MFTCSLRTIENYVVQKLAERSIGLHVSSNKETLSCTKSMQTIKL
jgi:hypothetical protein